MKTKLIISILLGLSALSFVINNRTSSNKGEEQTAVSPPQSNQDTTFLIGALNDGADYDFSGLDELGFNVWHTYTGVNPGWIWNGAPNDSLLTDISVYGQQVQDALETIESHGLKSMVMRPKIVFLTYGERSDYQCEDVSHVNSDLWFYTFQSPDHVGMDRIDSSQHGDRQWVRYCQPINQTDGGAGWVVSRLRANNEQCNSFAGVDSLSPIKNWAIKPRIRIDSTVADNPANWNTNVCKITVIGASGTDTLLKSNIKVINFLNAGNNYNGNYLEEFFRLPPTDSLKMQGPLGLAEFGSYGARGNSTTDGPNKIDIQVYWYGNCDMWIDYVRVDNMVAHDLLSKDSTNLTHQKYENWLIWEADSIACHNESTIKFYMELSEFSNIPCMAYVSRKIDSIAFVRSGRNITLTGLLTGIYSFVVPWGERFSVMNIEHIITNYVEKVGLSDILIPCYPFYTKYDFPEPVPSYSETFSKIPYTLPSTAGPGVLSNAISPSAYDDWLQNNLDSTPYYFETGSTMSFPFDTIGHQHSGAFRWAMQMGDAISKAKDIPFLYNGQAHVWFKKGETHREPTNQEMDMLANVSLTYGVRGLIYFWYPSYGDSTPGDPFYGIGFANPGNIPRTSNAYGQNKWEMIKAQVQRLKTWEPYIMSFDNANRKSYILRLERDNLIAETFFSDVITYKPIGSAPPCEEDDPGSNPSGLIYECKEDRYLQVATFQNSESNTKYFMVVNRRCSPLLNDSTNDNNGGRRYVRIMFDSGSSAFQVSIIGV